MAETEFSPNIENSNDQDILDQISSLLDEIDSTNAQRAAAVAEAKQTPEFQNEVIQMLKDRVFDLVGRTIKSDGKNGALFDQYLRLQHAIGLLKQAGGGTEQTEYDRYMEEVVKPHASLLDRRQQLGQQMFEFLKIEDTLPFEDRQAGLRTIVVEMQAIIEEQRRLEKATSQS